MKRYVKRYDFRDSATHDCVRYLDSINFLDLYHNNNVDEMVNILQSQIDVALSLIPSKLVVFTESDAEWMTPVIKMLIQKRWDAYRAKDFGQYHHYKTKVKEQISKAKMSWANKNSGNEKRV